MLLQTALLAWDWLKILSLSAGKEDQTPWWLIAKDGQGVSGSEPEGRIIPTRMGVQYIQGNDGVLNECELCAYAIPKYIVANRSTYNKHRAQIKHIYCSRHSAKKLKDLWYKDKSLNYNKWV